MTISSERRLASTGSPGCVRLPAYVGLVGSIRPRPAIPGDAVGKDRRARGEGDEARNDRPASSWDLGSLSRLDPS